MVTPIRYEIEHVSRYLYALPVRESAMSLCLKPREDMGQTLLRFEAGTDPPATLNEEIDAYGNTKHLVSIHREHESLEIAACSTVETSPAVMLPDSLAADAWQWIRSWRDSLEYWDFTHASEFARSSPTLDAFVERLRIEPEDDPLRSLLWLNDTIYYSFQYEPGSTSAVSPIEHILESGRGVCQDYAHVMLAIARSWGVPARYVSGYVPAGSEVGKQGPELATHAWVECLLPGLGWTGFDPTNRGLAGERHVRVAVGRDYRDVSPTRGVLRGSGDSRLEVEVRMREVATDSPEG